MRISEDDIQHIANLAHLSLSLEELRSYREQLTDILSYIEQLNEVDTEDVEITAQVGDLKNVWRDDVIKEWDEEEVAMALEQGDTEEGHIKVKKVL